jgi:hypothetical protein
MVSKKSKKIKSNKTNKTNKSKQRQHNKKQTLRKRYYQKGGIDALSADLDPPAYRDSYDETIYSKLNK